MILNLTVPASRAVVPDANANRKNRALLIRALLINVRTLLRDGPAIPSQVYPRGHIAKGSHPVCQNFPRR